MNVYLDKSFHKGGSLPVTKPKHPKGKPWLRYLALLALGSVLVWAFTGCATTKRTVYGTDGSKEVIEERKPAIEKDTKQFISDVFWSWSPRQRPVHSPEPAPAAPSK